MKENKLSAELTKGYALMFASVLTNSSTYIISKLLLKELSLRVFGIWWFGLGIFWNGLNILRKWRSHAFIVPSGRAWPWLVWIGLVEVVATFSFFTAVSLTPNPSIIAFLNNLAPVFVIILAVFFLEEKIVAVDYVAFAITLGGAILITGEALLKPILLFRSGSGYILVSAILYAVSTVSMKRNVKILDASLVTFNRSLLMFIACLLWYFIRRDSLDVRSGLWPLLLPGSIMGPFLTVFLTYSALRYIDASRVSVISTGRMFFVLLGTWLVFGVLPTLHQIWGGVMIILGIWMLTTGKTVSQQWIQRLIKRT